MTTGFGVRFLFVLQLLVFASFVVSAAASTLSSECTIRGDDGAVALCGSSTDESAVIAASVEDEGDDSIEVIRYDVAETIRIRDETGQTVIPDLNALVTAARDALSDADITRFVSRTGESLTSLEQILRLPKVSFPTTEEERTARISIIAKGDGEHFFWSAVNVGEEIPVTLPTGRKLVVRTLASRPRVFEIENLIDPSECDHIIEKAQSEGMIRSRVGNSEFSNIKSQTRLSSQLWVGETTGNDDDVFRGIRERVVNLTRLRLDNCEDTQIVYYDLHHHYYPHHDYHSVNSETDAPDRMVTVIYYLNDVPEGGETGFPCVDSHIDPFTPIEDPSQACSYGLRIKPKKGNAAMFYSMEEEGHLQGKIDPWSLHCGCDVLKGEKWIANQWIWNKRPAFLS